MKTPLILISLFLLFPFHSSLYGQKAEQGPYAVEKTSPFSAVKFADEKVFVLVKSEWFQFLNMDTLDAAWILEACKAEFGEGYKKRFSEDLVEFLNNQEIKPYATTSFTLLNEAGEKLEKELTFTRNKRNTSQAFFRKTYDSSDRFDPKKNITKAEMLQDIDALADILYKHHSYLHLKGLDIPKELEMLRKNLPAQQRILDFGTQLRKFINKLGDGHARVERWYTGDMGMLPFRTQYFQGKVIASKDQELLDAEYPYLASVNGIPVEDLMETSRAYFLSDIAPHFVNAYAAHRLYLMGFILTQHHAYQDKLEIQLINDQKQSIKKFVELQVSRSTGPEIEPISHKIIDKNIGYLKISAMASGVQEEVQSAMKELAKTEGLVIDVRDNGGGSREILLELMPYFIPENHPPVMGNLGVYRTDEKDISKEGVLRNRFMYPLTSSKFNDTDRDRIKEFIKTFKPSFNFDPEKYSDWHFLLIKADPNKEFYKKPVVVLLDEGCFSATDIFLSAFDQLEQVKLVGTTSGGGSGRTRSHKLPNSGWGLPLSSIISFQPNGKLYDGVGVSPDIEVPRASIDDVLGKTDNQLSFALEYIHKQSQK